MCHALLSNPQFFRFLVRIDEDLAAQRRSAGCRWCGADSTGPALIVRCTDRQDVMRCLDFASRHNLLLAMRNGRNEHAAWDDCDQGIAVDLNALCKPLR